MNSIRNIDGCQVVLYTTSVPKSGSDTLISVSRTEISKQIEIKIQINPSKPKVFEIRGNDAYKNCPYCGQGKFPFRYGVCICGKQVSDIQYVKNPKKFAKSCCSYVGYKTEKLGIEELLDD